ncbi:MAG: putative amidophosphoribosyltransferase [Parcubacteria group bacterium GW2011_GWC1_43_61]|nr:MAG: putative amidophosphoribosyltransferase [Candidatus Azambacteria bacterium GW2011_GWF1_41_10]KKS49332.1 MAG: putative amidophosphoribosyltransferase [Candidatus Azambacteria bacterium GW2011_GWF2_42_22]KKT03443.1 MAG: putative amidophosphoribosyltransferase [Candidatus Azambacteria bacterium GW2011_GWD1_43_18]KKT12471.1 MAG: putative amidophosphoribosyltransferase [Candidatus Azambacteria bacterium GW2011_GWC2_43_27]KKT16265.1 MAG: putative amidophosphoribosyltransferase [Parcubacteria 
MRVLYHRMNFINKTHLSPAKNFLLDLIFPRYCLGCGQEMAAKQSSQVCDICFNKIILNYGPQRQKNAILTELLAAGRYEDPILRAMILAFKYQSVESLKKPLAALMINFLKKEGLTDKFSGFVIAPVPLTWRRQLNRGFNQSELLANEIGIFLKCPVVDLLKRTKFNAPQAEIPDWKLRKENISGVFALNIESINIPFSDDRWKMGQLQNIQKVILVDDVSTSGATLEEAASILKKAGVKDIYGLVIAKG